MASPDNIAEQHLQRSIQAIFEAGNSLGYNMAAADRRLPVATNRQYPMTSYPSPHIPRPPRSPRSPRSSYSHLVLDGDREEWAPKYVPRYEVVGLNYHAAPDKDPERYLHLGGYADEAPLDPQSWERHQFLAGRVSATHFLHRVNVSDGDETSPITLRSKPFGKIDDASVFHFTKTYYKQDLQQREEGANLQARTPSTGPRPQPLSTWIHIQQQVLDFDAFIVKYLSIHICRTAKLICNQGRVSELCSANEPLKEPLHDFVRQLKADKLKPAQDGRSHHHLQPFCRLKKLTTPPDDRTSLTLMAACFPFLTLASALNPVAKVKCARTTHASMPLFEYKSGRSGHQLDRHQAICQHLGKADDRILHVSQLWLFVVNEELIITCSTLNESALRGEVISHVPPSEAPNIQVVTPNARLWLIEASKCATWLDFTSHFVTVAPAFDAMFTARMGEQVLSSANWHSVLEKCKHEVVRIHIDVMSAEDKFDHSPLLEDEHSFEAMAKKARQHAAERAGGASQKQNHLLNPCQDDAGIGLEEYARRLEAWSLRHEPSAPSKSTSSESRADDKMRSEPDYTAGFALLALVEQLIDFGSPGTLTTSESKLLAVVADLFDGTTCCVVPIPYNSSNKDVERIIAGCAPLFNLALILERNGCGLRAFREKHVHKPEAFDEMVMEVTAVLECLKTALQRQCAGEAFDITYVDHTTMSRIDEAYTTLLTNMNNNITQQEAVTPDGIAALLFYRLINISIHGSSNAMDIYRDHIKGLDMSARLGEPSLRPLSLLRYFKYELEAYLTIQDQQAEVLSKMIDSLFDMQTRDHTGVEGIHICLHNDIKSGALRCNGLLRVLVSCAETLRQREELIQEWHKDLDWIRHECRARLEEVQDWRENATVVFTVVTIIFLPLSFVSSLFGMNTVDVRDIQTGQWAFWASAVPFTMMIVALALYWVDVPPLRRWWARRRGREVF